MAPEHFFNGDELGMSCTIHRFVGVIHSSTHYFIMMYQHASNRRFARFERFLALHSVFVSVDPAFGEVSYHQQGLLHKICMP
jgi:hypothetical protein